MLGIKSLSISLSADNKMYRNRKDHTYCLWPSAEFELIFYNLFILQKHDIIKKRLDTHGDVIEERQDGIGSPKVCNAVLLEDWKFIS